MRALEKREKSRGRSVRSRSVRVFWDGGWVFGENMGISRISIATMVTIALKEPLDVALAKLWLFFDHA